MRDRAAAGHGKILVTLRGVLTLTLCACSVTHNAGHTGPTPRGIVMGMRNTYRPQIGPFAINFNNKMQVSSVALRLFGTTIRVWSRSGKTGVSSVDLPGPVSYRPNLKR